MKISKRIILAFFVIILLLVAILFIRHPYLIRVLQYRTPRADTYKIFPQAIVHKSDSAFHFIRSGKRRNDLDTLHVFDGNKQSITLKEYIKAGQINAFIVIRNDSVLYERYANNYTDSTLTSIFSGAKSMISIMIGQAIAEGKIKSLNDNVTFYIPN